MENLNHFISQASDFSPESLTAFLGCATEVAFRKSDYLLREGQICNAIYFISSGLCKSSYNKNGRDINTAFFFENDFATNISSLTSSMPSAYAIKACERTKAVRLNKTALLEAYRQFPQIESFGRTILAAIAAKQEAQADSFRLMTPKERFENLPRIHPDFLQRVPLIQIASYLGISRETLSRYRAIRSIM